MDKFEQAVSDGLSAILLPKKRIKGTLPGGRGEDGDALYKKVVDQHPTQDGVFPDWHQRFGK